MNKLLRVVTFCGLSAIAGGALANDAAVAAGPVAASNAGSGLPVGKPTLSFTVVDVTGAHKGKRTCYVCEFQDDPNVIGFFQRSGEDTAAMIEKLNALYLANKDKGFKAVVVLVEGPTATGWLEQLSATKKLEIPMVVLRKGKDDVAVKMYELNPEVGNTFLVNRNRLVVDNVSGIGVKEFDRVATAAGKMLAQK
jgi:hypothetical protein